MKRITALILVFLLLLSACSKGGKVTADFDFSETIHETVAATVAEVPSPMHDMTYGEWCVINGVRSGEVIPEDWYEKYYANICKALEEANGKLSATKNTEYSRAVLALSAIGKDVTNVAGYNLLQSYTDMEAVTKQGLPGAIFALIALDCKGYEIPTGSNVTRQALVNYILDAEFEGGGWAIIGSDPDTDITAQVLQALAPYMEDERVNAAAERAVSLLSELQNSEGGFSGWGGENAQSNAQVIIALTSLGIDLRTDGRFIKGENWLGSYIMKYYLGGGRFEHIAGKGYDPMATDQCLQALICITRLDEGKTRFYDFSDIS